MGKTVDIISIFQYQATIFYAQRYQMSACSSEKLRGINIWFLIEILSFYGYIFSAIIYILINICRSSFCVLKKSPELHKIDFIAYHRKDLDWAAFVQILFNVNLGLIILDWRVTYKRDDITKDDLENSFPLMAIQY